MDNQIGTWSAARKMEHAIRLLLEAKAILEELVAYVERVEDKVFNPYRGA